MITRWLKKIRGGAPQPQVYSPTMHQIRQSAIPKAVLRIIHTLHEHNFEAYVVGGGIRDLLLGQDPKDFDVATSARPEQVKKLFRRAWIIGRRFRIVHVCFGRETIEVTTFRAHQGSVLRRSAMAHNRNGQLLRDNAYGDLVSDSQRRDFTINALYYQPQSEEIIDYCGGYEDLKAGLVRTIGVDEKRFREDPMRMIRALRFAAKLELTLEANMVTAIRTHRAWIHDLSPARLFDEYLKLFGGGYAQNCFAQLQQFGIDQLLFPVLQQLTDDNHYPHHAAHAALLQTSLSTTDKRVNNGKSVTPGFLYAVLLWHPLQSLAIQEADDTIPHIQHCNRLLTQLFSIQNRVMHFPKRVRIRARQMLLLQRVLEQPRYPFTIFCHAGFRAAYDLLLLREQSGEIAPGMGRWWREFQIADRSQRLALCDHLAHTVNTAPALEVENIESWTEEEPS